VDSGDGGSAAHTDLGLDTPMWEPDQATHDDDDDDGDGDGDGHGDGDGSGEASL
jgi:hypothetical protein